MLVLLALTVFFLFHQMVWLILAANWTAVKNYGKSPHFNFAVILEENFKFTENI